MTAFRTRDPKAPTRALAFAGGGLVALGVLGAAMLTGAAQDRRADTIEMRDIVSLASQDTPETDPQNADLFYADDTPQLAQAALQANLQTLAQNHGAEIDVMRAEEVARIDGLIRLPMTLSGTVPEGELGAFLAQLDTARPAVVVEEVNLRRTRAARGATGRQVAFQFRLHGLSR